MNKERLQSFNEEVLPYHEGLKKFALYLTKNIYVAEDLLQDTYEKAFRNFHKYEKGTYIKSWLQTVMKNLYFTQLLSTKKERESVSNYESFEDIPYNFHPTENSIEENIDTSFLREKISTSLEKVRKKNVEAVIMSDYYEMSYQEIADEMNLPIGTVRSIIHRGRKKIHEEFVKDKINLN